MTIEIVHNGTGVGDSAVECTTASQRPDCVDTSQLLEVLDAAITIDCEPPQDGDCLEPNRTGRFKRGRKMTVI